MLKNTFIDTAKVMAKGQVTIPKNIRDLLGVSNGDHIAFVVEKGNVHIVNSAVFAMNVLQNQMKNEAQHSQLTSEDDIMDIVKEVRTEIENS
ncbi:MAG: AbrB/MazE/SpoVT family DNA-binding domain-containing protein [Verrucomicrobia bacterium]|nr:AbrB/MazE/SpoVT family DNA-binding domain-containing protein [Verrucomicrobiota bacterium]